MSKIIPDPEPENQSIVNLKAKIDIVLANPGFLVQQLKDMLIALRALL